MDKNSGFLVSYSYCEASDECLKDAWNYINRDCATDWNGGKNVALDDCNPESIACPDTFVSSETLYGSYLNQTVTLPEGAKCDVQVNTDNGLARVIFDETSYLGLDGTDKKLGDIITYDSGTGEHTITIYNAAESGPLTFLVSFSGAVQMGVLALSTLALASATL